LFDLLITEKDLQGPGRDDAGVPCVPRVYQ